MKVLITAGSTEVPIDKVRCISNIFKGKTGWNVARYFIGMCADVTLLTSNTHEPFLAPGFSVVQFRTFDELHNLMELEITSNHYDAVIHSAAVSDYKVSAVLNREAEKLLPIDSTKKVSSGFEKLYLELTPTIKLIDRIRNPWNFKGKLVKFKLQVGISDEELLKIARKSLIASKADYIVANCLEWSRERAYILGTDGSCENVTRDQLPGALHARLR